MLTVYSLGHELVSDVASPSLSLSQLTSIYKRFKAQNATKDAEESLHPLLLSALSSADLMSPTPPSSGPGTKTTSSEPP